MPSAGANTTGFVSERPSAVMIGRAGVPAASGRPVELDDHQRERIDETEPAASATATWIAPGGPEHRGRE